MTKPLLSDVQTAHTPGPWAVEQSGNVWLVRNTEKPSFTLLRSSKQLAEIACGRENREWEFMKLREAAPDMCSALDFARFVLSDGAFEGPLVDEAIKKIDAALAKAGGK